MAKIEMDISEYEEMKKNAALLQASLDKEQELNAKIDRLNQEKIEAMKANAKSVTVTEQVMSEEVYYAVLEPKEVVTRLQIFLSAISNRNSYEYNTYMHSPQNMIDYLISMIFEKHKMEATVTGKTVVHKGLDEVKAEIEREHREKYNQEFSKLAKYENCFKENAELRKQNSILQNGADTISKKNEQIMKNYKEIKELLPKNQQKLNELWNEWREWNADLQNTINRDISIFNYGTYKKDVTKDVLEFLKVIKDIIKKEDGNS